jgi:ligand-binding sensor domain-containing protein
LTPSPGFDGQPAGEATGWEPDTPQPTLSSFSPAPNALPASTPADAGPFRLASPDEGLPEGAIHDLWIDPLGYLWIASDQGIARDSAEGWSQLLDEPVERVQGVDAQGRVWVILEGEMAVAAYDASGTWSFYGPEQGWAIPQAPEYLSPGYGDGLVTDAQGRVWLATGRDDLRRFDPKMQTWSSLTATDLGFDPPEEEGYQGHFLSDVEEAEDQELWVGDCIGSGEALSGQGILKSDGKSWFADRSTAGECVQDIEKDGSGRMWVGDFNALHQYDPTSGSWSRFPLPPWDRRQLVMDIMLDPNDNPWVEIMRYGGASPLGGLARYHLQEGEWFLDFDGWFSSLAFTSDGVAWLCSEGIIHRLEGGKADELGNIGGLACEIVVDGEDRVWVTNHAGLWRHESEE